MLREVNDLRYLGLALGVRAATVALLGDLEAAEEDMAEATRLLSEVGDLSFLDALDLYRAHLELGHALRTGSEHQASVLDERILKRIAHVEKPGPALWTAQEIHEKLDHIFRFDAAAPAVAAGDDIVTAVFAHFPAGFKKGKLASWTANLQWVVKGGTDQTILIENDACTAEQSGCGIKIPVVEVSAAADAHRGRP